ncbi:probable RNA-binding protein CG14230 [Anabrus simplex]|uniref:probable RNA-binding protein CG14230 n=1 Tax=Anabrus simplex TaxID=316456 RepID=UPI0035A2F80A
MKVEKKRLFVGNLPPSSTEELLIKKFKKFGKVLSVELKRRADGSTFAFLDLDIKPNDVESCLHKVSKKSWDGYEIKVELAKESFLSRLERERELAKSKSSISSVNKEQLQSQISKSFREEERKDYAANICSVVKTPYKIVASSDEDTDGKTERKRGNIPMFRGTQSIEWDESDTGVQEHSPKKSFKEEKRKDYGANMCIDVKAPYKTVASSDEDTDGKTERKRGNIPMFRGTQSIVGDESDTGVQEHSPKISCAKPEIEREMLQKFESFSDVWRDDSTDNSPSYNVERKQKKNVHKQTKELSDKHSAPKMKQEAVDQFQRNLVAEERRLKSIAERKKSFLQQKQAVRTALMKIDLNASNSKKIILDDEEDNDIHRSNASFSGGTDVKMNSSETLENSSKDKKGKLFSDDESEDEDNDFKIKSQFEGIKGQKLLALQARYANDKRFTLDERFYESDDNTEEKLNSKPDEVVDEKKNQLRILGSILGQELRTSEDKTTKQKRKSMLRFDPTKPDHEKYEVKKSVDDSVLELENDNKLDEKASRKKIKKEKTETVESSDLVPKVSKTKYYEVSDTLKDSLKKSSEGFSLLEMFGSNDSREKEEEYQDGMQKDIKTRKQIGWSINPFKYDSSESEDEQEPAPVDKSVNEQREAWHESFFFTPNDSRLKEGLQFLKRKVENEDNFAAKRRELKQIIRYKVKNNQKKKLAWKKKLGGKKHHIIHEKKKKQKFK